MAKTKQAAAATAVVLLASGNTFSLVSASADHQQPANQLLRPVRRLRFAQSPSTGIDASSYFDESPLINEAFGDLEDIAETEKFFRRLGGSMSMSKSKSKKSVSKDTDDADDADDMDVGSTGASMDVPTPTAKPPTMKPPTMKSPTMKLPTMKPPTMKPPTMKPPTMKPPTMKPPTTKPPTPEPAPGPTPKPPTAKPPTAGIEPQPRLCSLEGEKAEECGADPKPGRPKMCCEDLVCNEDRICEAPVSKPSESPVAEPTNPPVEQPSPVSKPTEFPVADPTDPPVEEPSPVSTPTESPVAEPTSPGDTPAPTPLCNLDVDERSDAIFQELSVINQTADLTDSSTPQGAAFQWIVADDDMKLCPDDEALIQRYVAAVLYYSTDGNGWSECFADDTECGVGQSYYGGKEPWLSGSSECDWAGLQCNLIGEITRIELYDNNLGGTVPMELGSLLVADTIELHENKIEGEMPTAVCDNITPLGELLILTSDCGGSEPLIKCACCTRCYRP